MGNLALAYYGLLGQGWPIERSLRAFDGVDHIDIAVLWNTFGRDLANLERFCAEPRIRSIEIHLTWEGHGVRPIGTFEFSYGIPTNEYSALWARGDANLVSRFKRYSKPVAALVARYPGIAWYISPSCESNVGVAASAVMLRVCKEIFPQARLVWSAVGKPKNQIGGTALCEVHGLTGFLPTGPYIANLDGSDLRAAKPAELAAWYAGTRNAERAGLWTNGCNGSEASLLANTRARRSWPSQSTFQRFNQELRAHQ